MRGASDLCRRMRYSTVIQQTAWPCLRFMYGELTVASCRSDVLSTKHVLAVHLPVSSQITSSAVSLFLEPAMAFSPKCFALVVPTKTKPLKGCEATYLSATYGRTSNAMVGKWTLAEGSRMLKRRRATLAARLTIMGRGWCCQGS